MRRITMVLMVAVVMLVAVAGPVLAQNDKAARKAERQAARAAKQAQKAQNPAPSAQQKPLPATGGGVVDLGLLGAGALLVGGGIVAARVARR